MSPADPLLPLYVMPHARERARERFPGFKAARIVEEVRAAFREGRTSPCKPVGIKTNEARYRDCFYCWTPDGDRVYAVKLDRYVGDRFIVVTTLSRERRAA